MPGTTADRESRGEEMVSSSPSAPSALRREPGRSGSGAGRGSCRPPASSSTGWSRRSAGSENVSVGSRLQGRGIGCDGVRFYGVSETAVDPGGGSPDPGAGILPG